MPRYFQKVVESRTYDILYTVEAKDEEEARHKIAIGNTIREKELKQNGVFQRDLIGDIFRVIPNSKIPQCPKCNGERELSGSKGRYNCLFCGLKNAK